MLRRGMRIITSFWSAELLLDSNKREYLMYNSVGMIMRRCESLFT
jgi:hypothetical protein